MSKVIKEKREPIAVVGIGCRFPGGVTNPESYFDMLVKETDAITEVPEDRWNLQKYYDANRDLPGKTYTRRGGFLDKIDEFDAQFFGISPREASLIDPQQRLLLEVCWEAFEDGGLKIDDFKGKTGVFVGGFTLDYKYLQFQESNRELFDSHSATGAMMTLLANRLSYVFDFQGPSMAIDTACSSSLVAVHLACQSLWNGESDQAVAGGVNIMLKPDITIAESKAGMLSPDGHSKAFDSRANGYVRGEGAGIVLLKPLSEAEKNGDQIYAIIRGTACNQDGQSSGLTVPRGDAQQALLREAYANADIEPKDIQYVEAHGTGTPVGDPIEANALGTVLSDGRAEGDICYMGSVKTNFGHTEAAAGVAGFIKAVLSLKHGYIFKHLHLIEPNPKIDLKQLKMRIPDQLTEWPAKPGKRIAGVNSFGFGGTNAHIVLQDYVSHAVPSEEDGMLRVVPLSAKNKDALKNSAQRWVESLGEEGLLYKASLTNLAYSASEHRDHHAYRLSVVAKSKEELTKKLQAYVNEETRAGLSEGQAKENKVVFVYTGMGPQWWGMGHQLYNEEPIFRKTLDTCDELFKGISGWSLLEEMLKDETSSRMAETEIAQPANFFIQVGLTELWKSYGVVPSAIVGHSAGEAASAYVAGAMSLEEAVKVIYHRSRLQQLTTGKGKLVAVSISHEEIKTYLQGYEDRVSIAAINSPTSVTLVGDPEALENVVSQLQEVGVFCKYLYVKVPYHSHYMDPLRDELLEVLADVKLEETTIPLYSTVTGKQIAGTELDAHYWWLNVRDSVYFADAAEQMIEDGYRLYVEVGPHPVLAASINECIGITNQTGIVVPSLRRGQDEKPILLDSVGKLFTEGVKLNWSQVNGNGQFVKLPSYPWQRVRYWHESEASQKDRIGQNLRPLLGVRLHTQHPTWETEISKTQVHYLEDHQIQGSIVFPGACYLEMVSQGITDLHGGKPGIAYEIIGGEFHKALFLNQDRNCTLQLSIDSNNGKFRIVDSSKKELPLHSSGSIRINSRYFAPMFDLQKVQSRMKNEISKDMCYRRFRQLGLEYGPTFQGIEQIWQSENEALAKLKLPESISNEKEDYNVHPIVVDLMFQALAAALPFDDEETVYMPTGVERAINYGSFEASELWVHTTIKEKNDMEMKGDIRLVNEKGVTLIEIFNCRAKSLKDDTQNVIGAAPMTYSELLWKEQELVTDTESEKSEGIWIVLSDSQKVGSGLVNKMMASGKQVIVVECGACYEEVEQGKLYKINPSSEEDYTRLLLDISQGLQKAQVPSGMIHMFSLEVASSEGTSNEMLEQAGEYGCKSVLYLTQAVNNIGWDKLPQLWFVTCGAQSVDGEEIYSVGQAPLWGMSRVIGHQEHRQMWGGIIDLDPFEDKEQLASLLEQEIDNKKYEDQVAFRNGKRFVARLKEYKDVKVPMTTSLRSDASYMITGGFGALGQLMASYLIERGARHIILVGRENLPSRSTWKQLEPGSRLASRCEMVKKLESLGAHVHVAGFDIADQDALAQFISGYERDGWPEIRGVIHSAGTSKPQMLMSISGEEFSSVLRPKVQGGWNLHNQFKEKELDFFVLFSSVASLIVSPGQSNYSAGNEFLDALARYRYSLGLPALSINWGPWGEIGMATQLDLVEFFVKRGNYPISTVKGIEAFANVMSYNRPQVIVSPIVWSSCCQNNYSMGEYPAMLEDIAISLEGEQDSQRVQSTEVNMIEQLKQFKGTEERIQFIEAQLQDIVARVMLLNRSELTTEHSLTSLGLDSMLALELKARLDKAFQVNILVVDLMRDPTISNLARQLLEKVSIDLDMTEETVELLTELENMSEEEIAQILVHSVAASEELK